MTVNQPSSGQEKVPGQEELHVKTPFPGRGEPERQPGSAEYHRGHTGGQQPHPHPRDGEGMRQRLGVWEAECLAAEGTSEQGSGPG